MTCISRLPCGPATLSTLPWQLSTRGCAAFSQAPVTLTPFLPRQDTSSTLEHMSQSLWGTAISGKLPLHRTGGSPDLLALGKILQKRGPQKESEERVWHPTPLRTVSPRARARARAGVRDWGQRGTASRQAKKKERAAQKGPSPSSMLGTGDLCGLTFLILLLLLLSASSKQCKDDACLGVHTHSCHHHSSRAFHDMSAWHSQHRETETEIYTAGWEACSAPTGSVPGIPEAVTPRLEAPGGCVDPKPRPKPRPWLRAATFPGARGEPFTVPCRASSLSVLLDTAFATGLNTGLRQNLLEREHHPHWLLRV